MKKQKATDNAASQLPPEVRPGQSIELLKQLHILTREGKLNQDSRRKLKQVYHLFQFIEKLLLELPASETGPTLADHGAGKSYLGFIIYDLFFKALGQGTIYGIETRSELVESSKALAQKLGFERMRFLNVSVAESTQSDELPAQIDVVTALHACDTATDDAIAFGLARQARFMVLVVARYANVTAPAVLGRPVNLYWDGRHTQELISTAVQSVPGWQVGAALATLCLGLWACWWLVRAAIVTLADCVGAIGAFLSLPPESKMTTTTESKTNLIAAGLFGAIQGFIRLL